MDKIILKLSGEALKGDKESGIDTSKLIHFAKEIKAANDLDTARIGIIVGGGNFFRGRDALKIGLSRVDTDYMGMLGTILNAIALNDCLSSMGAKVKTFSSLPLPTVLEEYNKDEAIKYLENGYITIFAGGTGKPYCSTDSATLMKARDVKARMVIMGKNGVDGVYTDDPKTNPNAKKYDILTHKEILDNKLNVMDLEAAAIAEEENIDIFVFNIDEENAIARAIKGEIEGTTIKKEI